MCLMYAHGHLMQMALIADDSLGELVLRMQVLDGQ